VERTPAGYGFKVTVELTSGGKKWLGIVEDVLATLRRHAKEVPSAMARRWQEASSGKPQGGYIYPGSHHRQ
jgi:hypothetical protein